MSFFEFILLAQSNQSAKPSAFFEDTSIQFTARCTRTVLHSHFLWIQETLLFFLTQGGTGPACPHPSPLHTLWVAQPLNLCYIIVVPKCLLSDLLKACSDPLSHCFLARVNILRLGIPPGKVRLVITTGSQSNN